MRKKKSPLPTRQKSFVKFPTDSKPAKQQKNTDQQPNRLFYGDNLDILKKHIAKESIDLIYIDPPFNSKRTYNVLFENIDMKDVTAQKQAFADTWSNYSYIDELNELATIHKDLFEALSLFHKLKSINDSAVAYLTTMAIRIYYMHKSLKSTGSFYLHVDPTMSHYLKLICDMIFGEKNFRNEITWQRTNTHNDAKYKFADVNDIILFYVKSNEASFSPQYVSYNDDYIKKFYRFNDNDGKGFYSLGDLGSPNPRPNMMYEWKGFLYPQKGWRFELNTMKRLHNEGRIYYPTKESGLMDYSKRPRLKRYLNEQKGTIIGNNWTDILPLAAHEVERLKYPTQKPEALLERIINASSNEGDVVADFFCGCGTTIGAAQKLNRRWIGADISHLATKLITKRLIKDYGRSVLNNIKVDGMPQDIASAKDLAENTKNGRFSFQEWAIEVMLNGVVNEKKSGDGGFDGYIAFESNMGKQFGLIEVKSGKIGVGKMREFVEVINCEKAVLGIYVCFKDYLTKDMIKKARDAGKIKIGKESFRQDKIQIITVEELFEGRQPEIPFNAENKTLGSYQKVKKEKRQPEFNFPE